jgi:hypothetical protein
LATNQAAGLKLVEFGVSREKLTLLSIPLGAVNMVWPLIISKAISKHNPLMIYIKAHTIRYFNPFFIKQFSENIIKEIHL